MRIKHTAINEMLERPHGIPCECTDPGCSAHRGADCPVIADCTVLYRVDMADESGTAMCDKCADDAFSTGLFTTHDM